VSSYTQIIKSSALIGGSSILNIVLGLIRTKFLAILLGPAGVGLMGTYTSIASTFNILAGIGLSSSGVRQIAEAAATGQSATIARTVVTLRRVALFLGVAGAVVMVLLSPSVSWLTFHSYEHSAELGLLAITVLFATISGGQTALVQGMRRVLDLAKLNVLGAFWGTVLSIPIIWYGGQQGVVPFLIIASGMTTLCSWWYARKLRVDSIQLGWRETMEQARGLLRLGFVFMASAVMTSLVAYASRVIIIRSLNVEATGQFQAAWTLSTFYVGFILQAMGADFYPRLTAAAKDDELCKKLINEQVEVGLLLAAPGILTTLSLAPLVIGIFYSPKFGPAIEVLRWQILGVLLRVVIWPMAYILVAKGNARLFFWTEVLANGLHIALIWLGISYWGLVGAGVAFFLMYTAYFFLILILAKRLIGFSWSHRNTILGTVALGATTVVFCSIQLLPKRTGLTIAGVITVPVSIVCFRWFCRIVSPNGFPGLLLIVRRKLGF
jgi:O-antigen/teichoic acid export membrane protein